jgi:hypothetical protein
VLRGGEGYLIFAGRVLVKSLALQTINSVPDFFLNQSNRLRLEVGAICFQEPIMKLFTDRYSLFPGFFCP